MSERETAQRFPLSWPPAWKRTPRDARKRAVFGTKEPGQSKRAMTLQAAITRLTGEMSRLGANEYAAILSTNVPVRLDGFPYSGMHEPDDPGAALYFKLTGADRVLACDKWDRVADNIAAIALHIDALRRIDRYGVGTVEQAFAGYAALPPSPSEWWIVLGVPETATVAQIEDAFRVLARRSHPDAGGSHEQMARINAARDHALEARRR